MKPNIARRSFFKGVSAGLGAACLTSFAPGALAATATKIIVPVENACRRLAPLGWRDLLLTVSGGALDITASNLELELLKPLKIDRKVEGFGDFSIAGKAAVTPDQPNASLLYHAFASATVVSNGKGSELLGFPTLAEIDALENFIYGVKAPTWEELKKRAKRGTKDLDIGVVVFASHYRNTPDSVHGKHAELCFSRTGIARVGSIEAYYDGKLRTFSVVDEKRPFEFRVVPRRFSAYLAVRTKGDSTNFGPQDPLNGDADLDFWVPLHKLFNGDQCIAGKNLTVNMSRNVQNDEIAQFHRFLSREGKPNNWKGAVLEEFPFTISNERIASLANDERYGPGVLLPLAQEMTSVAKHNNIPVTFPVYPTTAADLQMSSLFVIPGVVPPETPAYEQDAEQNSNRQQPEYTNVRHKVNADGTITNLNNLPDLQKVIQAGNYQALHYNDYTGDGWVEASCPQLADLVKFNQAAYCMVGLPDFFPKMTQRDLMLWSEKDLAKNVSASLWAIRPLTLSQTRIAANINLPIGFSIKDVTITTIVGQFNGAGSSEVQVPNGPLMRGKVGLPDGSPGLFDPGWDTSQGIHYTVMGSRANPAAKLEKYLAGYSLGSPFIEDAKLCAALGSYWPGVAPDATRTFQPGKQISGKPYPWPTVVPLTDIEIGSAPLPGGTYMPWDGVTGPTLSATEKNVAVYTNIFHTDYIDLIGTMTAALTSKISPEEYKARVLAMETVYWNLGIHGERAVRSCHFPAKANPVERMVLPNSQKEVNMILRCKAAWAVLNFNIVQVGDLAFLAAKKEAGPAPKEYKMDGGQIFHFHVFRWNPEKPETVMPTDFRKVKVEMLERATFYVSNNSVLMKNNDGQWKWGTGLPSK